MVYWQLTGLGVPCEVVAPTLVPVKAGDRVKTDRRDAEKLARSYRAGDLTPVWVPDAAHEALRDLVRAREAAKKDQLRARHRLGQVPCCGTAAGQPTGMTAWTQRHLTWVNQMQLRARRAQEASRTTSTKSSTWPSGSRGSSGDRRGGRGGAGELRAVIEALQALRGVALIGRAIVAEVGTSPGSAAPQLMGYSGRRAAEDSSGARTRAARSRRRATPICGASSSKPRGRIGTGRRSVPTLRSARRRCPQRGQEIAWKAQHRLHARYAQLIWAREAPERGDGGRARAPGLHLGHRGGGANAAARAGVAAEQPDEHARPEQAAVEGPTERRILDALCGRPSARPALLVRGSSRRITIMRCRPANIRVINRRVSRLDRRLVRSKRAHV